MTSLQTNTALVQSCYQAFGMGDMARLFDQLHDTVEWHSLYIEGVSLNGIYSGKKQLGELFTKMGSDLTISAFAPTDFLATESTVVVLGSEEAMVNKTQKTYQNRWVHIWQIDGGKVAKITTYNTVENVLRAYTA
jgi:ketosteroid isomerase-like protein